MVEVGPRDTCKIDLEVSPPPTHECTGLLAYMVDETRRVVGTLLRWASFNTCHHRTGLSWSIDSKPIHIAPCAYATTSIFIRITRAINLNNGDVVKRMSRLAQLNEWTT